MKILIAEDNAVNRELLRELLEMRGFEVFEACNGKEALEMIESVCPDLLVLDLGMPVLDGFGAIEKIRANPQLAHLPVLAATAYAMRGDRDQVLKAGFDGYVSKPINSTALNQEIDRLMGAPKNRETNARSADSGSTT
ncbi:MAG: response regulator [Candidatus Sulfotelmatobacter sp.]|jgi:CheY-like chemotaxis protein